VFTLPDGRLREPRHLGRSVRRLASLMGSRDPDLILNWLSTAQLYGAPAAVRAGMSERVVWWQHDLNSSLVSRGRILDQAANLLPALAIGACSEAAAEAQRRLAPHRRVVAVHPGIDTRADVSDSARSRLERELAIPPGRLVVGSVGRILPWKGHHRVLGAVELLAARGHDAHALIVGGNGDNRYGEDLRALARRRALEDRVTFTGHVADAAPSMELMDVLVSGADDEPFGLVILEAMAAGLPIVAPNRAGPGEILEHRRTGWLVATPAPGDLAAGIEALIGTPGLGHGLGAAARTRRADYFTAERMTREMETMLLDLIA
ncbi:MAG: glycosyltransferase family 4 protein, partial [Actinomycetota bacterium]|nr:glycosyltransferase family 4 protein [Actinomycetota bacterium]